MPRPLAGPRGHPPGGARGCAPAGAVAQERVNYTPVAQERVNFLYADVGGSKIRLPHCPKAAVAGVLAIFIVVATALIELMFRG